ncbi:uncharacterized protein LOC144004143 isoform X1 [Festucalex cinctus]
MCSKIPKLPDRHIVYCLRCCKPQEKISVHLTKACMKESTREEVEVQVRKAKASTKEWLRNGRRIDYLDLLKRFPHRKCRHTLTRMLVELGFFVSNMPQESDMEPVSQAQDPDIRNADAAASTSAATASGSYHIKPSCSQEVRRAIETLAGQQLDRSGKEKVSHYLAHLTSLAEQHYRMRASQSVVEIADILDEMAGFTQPKPPESGPSATDTKSLWSDFDAFVKAFPVTRLGQPPTKKMRMEAGFSEDRTNYDEWRKQQYEQREQYLLSYYTSRKPDAAKLKKLIDDEGFVGNCPLPKDIVSK